MIAVVVAAGVGALGVASPSPATTPATASGAPRPRIHNDPIPFGKERKRETAAYSRRHYGQRTWRLRNPRVIVLHYTTSSTYPPVFNTFASNAPSVGELPGTCSHFVIGKNGAIHRLVPLDIRCRHAIGLNYTAIGIEMVQEQLSSSHASDEAILHRAPQIHAALHLVRWLRARYGIAMKNVIGHAMANKSPYFKDREGWKNDHTDWQRKDVVTFRKRLRRLERSGAESKRTRGTGRIRFGRSVDGRPLIAEESGNPDAKRTALVVGQIHGNEPAGRSVVRLLRRRHGIHGVDLWTVKTVNPDGNRLDTRQNAHGVDLNRNFPLRWSRSSPSSSFYGGPHPFSEPESRAVRRLVERIHPDVSIWYHQPWDAVLSCHRHDRILRRYAHVAGMAVACKGKDLPGTAIRWENHRVGGKAFVVELAANVSEAAIRRNARAAARIAVG
jgi:N-acetylmuramoyl-L-alanine amidase